jgi:PHD/YefM family antitoxin component YafN of YafNO toxin-antitoxin module
MKTIEMSKASKTLAEYAEDLSEDLIVVTSRRKPIAALVSLKGLDIEAAALASNPRFLAILKRSYEEIQAGRAVSHDQMKNEFGSSKPKTIGKRSR